MSFYPRAATTPEVSELTETLLSQIMSVMGLKRANLLTRTLHGIFHTPARRMAKLLVELDQNISQQNLYYAADIFVRNFVSHYECSGSETIPKQGPLMVVSNHPAAYDVFILVAAIKRPDLMVLASDIQIIQMLPHMAEHVIPVPYHIPSRLHTIRATEQHLQDGGAIFLFPRGNIEPDPAVSPGAEQSLLDWSSSVGHFVHNVPETISVVAAASGMLSAKWYKNPLINIWKKYEQRQKVAEIFQVASQLFTGRVPTTNPRVTFSPPLTINELGGESAGAGVILASLTSHVRNLLASHQQPRDHGFIS